MKIELTDDGFRIFIQNYYFKDVNWEMKEEVINIIKNLFRNIKKYYHMQISGLYKIKVYPTRIGIIVDSVLLDKDIYGNSDLDLRIVIVLNKDVYFKTDDISFVENLNSFYHNNFYYVDINDIDDIIKYIEFGSFVLEEEIK